MSDKPDTPVDNPEEQRKDLCIKGYDAEIRKIDRKEKSVTAYVSTVTKDAYNEVVLPVFDLSRFQKNPVVLFAHDYWGLPVGKSLWQKADDTGLMAKTQFNVKTQFSADVWNMYADGFLKAFSIGYLPRKRVRPGDDEWADLFEQYEFDASAREIHTENELWEYSAVPVPANPDAVVDMIKSGIVQSRALTDFFEREFIGNVRGTIDDMNHLDIDEIDRSDLVESFNDMLRELNAIKNSLGSIQEENKLRAPLWEELAQMLNEIRRLTQPVPQPEEAVDGHGLDWAKSKTSEIVDGAFRKLSGRVS